MSGKRDEIAKRIRRHVVPLANQRNTAKEYERTRFWERARFYGEAFGGGLVLLILLGFVPLIVSHVFAASFRNDDVSLDQQTAYAFCIHSAFYVGLVLMVSCRPAYGLYWPLRTVVYSFFPRTDRRLLLDGVVRIGSLQMLFTYPTAVFYCIVAAHHGMSAGGYWAAIGLAFAHGVVFVCAAMLGIAKVPSTPLVYRVNLGVGLVIMVLSMIGGVFGRNIVADLSEVPAAFSMIPPAWVDGAMFHALVRGRGAGWLFLIPCGVLVTYFGCWLATARISKQPLIEAALGNTEGLTKMNTALNQFMSKPERPTLDRPVVEEDEAEDPWQRIQEGLRDVPLGRRGGPMWLLTRNQRRSFHAWCCRMPSWWARYTMLAVLLLGMQVLNVIPRIGHAHPNPLPLMMLIGMVVSMIAWAGPTASYPRNGLYATFPLSARELVKAYAKIAATWAAMLLPVIGLCALIRARLAGYEFLPTLLLYAKIVPGFVCWTTAFPCFSLVLGKGWRWSLVLAASGLVFLMMAFLSFGGLIFGTQNWMIWAGLVGTIVTPLLVVNGVLTLLAGRKVDLKLDAAKRQADAMKSMRG